MTVGTHLIRGRDVSSLPVVTISGGDDAAEIKDVVYDATRHHLVGFTLNKRGWFRGTMKALLPTEAVVGIGSDAVMVGDEGALTQPADTPDVLSETGEAVDVIGNDVVSAGGQVLGTVIDVILETGPDPQAVGYEVKTSDGPVFVPSSAQMAISGTNLIVPEGADEFIGNDLVGFGASVRAFRDRLGTEGTP